MKYLVFFALIAMVAAKPMPGYLSGLDIGGHGLDNESSYAEGHAAPVIQTAQVVHAAPIIHAPIAIAKPQATSYSSFQRVIHPVAHHVVQAAPVVHAPVIHSAPLLELQSHESISDGYSLGHDYGHGWSKN